MLCEMNISAVLWGEMAREKKSELGEGSAEWLELCICKAQEY